MVQKQTLLKISDNSGAKTAKCIKVIGTFEKKYAKPGDIIIVSIQQVWNNLKKKVKMKNIYKAFVLKTKFEYKNKIGIQKLFKYNTAVLLNKQNNLIGTRVVGFTPTLFRKKKYQKFISVAIGLT